MQTPQRGSSTALDDLERMRERVHEVRVDRSKRLDRKVDGVLVRVLETRTERDHRTLDRGGASCPEEIAGADEHARRADLRRRSEW